MDQHGALSLDAIGAILGVTRERVRQIEARALAKLERRAASRRELAAYHEIETMPPEVPLGAPGLK